MNVTELQSKSTDELAKLAKEAGLEENSMLRDELVFKLMENDAQQQGFVLAHGVLEIMPDGYGFLRQNGVRPSQGDVYVSQSQIRRFSLRTGDSVTGQVRPPKDSERYFGLIRVEGVNGQDPEKSRGRSHFDNLTPVYPTEQLSLESSSNNLAQRVIDLVAPLGRGQRALIVSPPKAGKTFLIKDIANGISSNHEDVHLMIVLAGERPEEVTDLKRAINGETFASTFDEPVENHCRTAEVALERAKRLVEIGRHVVVLLDSMTRLVRGYNLALPSTGRTLSGGIDTAALYPPKRFFGAARNTEEGGSLTIVATCLIDTGSRMDEVIYEEFKGTGNAEIHLDRRLAEKRVFPSIDIQRSGTRREELLLGEDTLRQVWLMRRMLSMLSSGGNLDSGDATERVLEYMKKAKNNTDFLLTLKDMGKDIVRN
ncbi:MAG: transcription termination factor Rho [Chloroflexi bacterium]|nr:transcription termination factor Rho [Chloroflexota bacterium]|tara:strand:+ start:8792 stop:10072 length:1281 start_codon:yes stop_codon:yes gene_type:complete